MLCAIGASLQSKAPFLVRRVKVSHRTANWDRSVPAVFLAKLFLTATKSLKPWPVLWPPTLAMKSQKPCLNNAPRCASNTASERTTARCSLCASPTARRRPLYEGAARGESTKQRASARDCPRATLWQPSQLRLQALNVSATPSEEIAAAVASAMARRVLEVVTTVGSFASLKQSSFASPREDPLRGSGARDRPSQAQ